MTLRLALVGAHIAHSKSPAMYQELLDLPHQYDLLDYASEKEIPPLKKIFETYQGINITAPYKRHFLPEVMVDEKVVSFGAVNCIKREGETFLATNTDYLAVELLLKKYRQEFGKLNLVLLGSGVMAKMTVMILEKWGWNYSQFSRGLDGDLNNLNYPSLVDEKKGQMILINSCSRDFVLTAELDQNILVWDYNYLYPPHAESLGARCQRYDDGLELLKLQAVEAIKFWQFS